MADVIPFGGITKLPLTPEKVLDGAKRHIPEELMVLGWTKEGKLYIAGTHSDIAHNLGLLAMGRIWLEQEMYKMTEVDDDPKEPPPEAAE